MSEICRDCPRDCQVPRPANGVGGGFCRMPFAPVVARAGLHRWEEPVISGTRGSGAVFFSGCNLRCVFCQNYDISSQCKGREIDVARLGAIYRELIAQGAHNINLVTPSHFSGVILASLDQPPPVPVLWNSNGYDRVETLRRFEGKIQIYLPDLKYSDNAVAAKYSGAADYFATASAAIDEMYRQTGPFRIGDDGLLKSGVVVRHLILPGLIDNSLRVIDYMAKRFKPGEVMFSLMRQYLPCGRVTKGEFPELNRRLTDEEYDTVEQYLFDSGIEDGFVQEKESASGEFIPNFDGTGV